MRGFTIVELLIVIVVIAVLAAVVSVAYSGVQRSARNTQRIAAAKEWQKIIHLYIAANGRYPAGSSNVHYCLGNGYATDWDGNPDQDCATTANIKHVNIPMNTAYQTIVPSLPAFPATPITVNGGAAISSGISMRSHDTLDPSGTPRTFYPVLLYWLEGNGQDCVLRPIMKNVTSGISIATDGSTYTANDGLGTQCRIALPYPADI